MKKINFFAVIFILVSQLLYSQKTSFDNNQIYEINAEHHGLSLVNLFNTCTDPVCFENIKELKPKVVRFPSAGDAEIYNLNLETAGYGINFDAVAAYLSDRYNCNPFENPNYTFIPKLKDDPFQIPLHYNNKVCPKINSELEKWYNNYRKQQTDLDQESYLLKFIRLIKDIEDRLPNGQRVDIIYTANISSATPDDLVNTIKQMTDSNLNGIKSLNVVGIEIANEPWGKLNNDCWPEFNDFYSYVRGDSAKYKGSLTVRGDFISIIKTNFPDIKIAMPVAPLNIDYFGCNVPFSPRPDFTLWNSQLATYLNDSITVIINEDPISLSTFDALTIHHYFNQHYWAVKQEGENKNTCINCLENKIGTKELKNYLRDLPLNQPYSFYPSQEDSILKASFDCMIEEIFKFMDSGFVDKLMTSYKSDLGITQNNKKKIWMTEWNILHNKNDDTTLVFHNTFAHAVLIAGWKMAMYRSNWKIDELKDFFQYSTYYNGVSETQHGALSPRKNTGDYGDGVIVDANSDKVRRMGYWANYVFRNISLQSLKWIDFQVVGLKLPRYLRLYPFVDQINNYLYLYFINAEDADFTMNIDSINFPYGVLNSSFYSEYFNVRNNYSTAGYASQYEFNEYYKTGKIWEQSLDNEPYNNYNKHFHEGNDITLLRKSIGFIRIPYNSTGNIGRKVNDGGINIFPNPTNGIISITLDETVSNVSIKIMNTFGQTVIEKRLKNGDSIIDMTDLINGIYVVHVNSGLNNKYFKIILIK